MMFSSNQEFRVSGENRKDDLAAVIDFAMRLSGCHEMFTRKDRPVTVAYQVTGSGLYLIGKGRRSDFDKSHVPGGWTEFPFDYDPGILAAVVSQWLAKQPRVRSEFDGYDGSTHCGFLCRAVKCLGHDEYDGIENPFSGVICFSPFTCFYAK